MALWTGKKFDKTDVSEFTKSGCNGLRISKSLGTTEVDLAAVGQLEELRAFQLYFLYRKYDFTALENLRDLSLLGTDSRPSQDISANLLRSIEILMCTWSPKYPKLNLLPSIKYVNADRVSSLLDFVDGICPKMERVCVSTSKLSSLDGLNFFPSLKIVEAHICRFLDDVSAIQDLDRLEEVSITSCRKISDVSDMFTDHVRRVHIESCGDILMSKVSCPTASLKEFLIIDCSIDESILGMIRGIRDQLDKLVLPPRYMNML